MNIFYALLELIDIVGDKLFLVIIVVWDGSSIECSLRWFFIFFLPQRLLSWLMRRYQWQKTLTPWIFVLYFQNWLDFLFFSKIDFSGRDSLFQNSLPILLFSQCLYGGGRPIDPRGLILLTITSPPTTPISLSPSSHHLSLPMPLSLLAP